jgi:hypothetical protein
MLEKVCGAILIAPDDTSHKQNYCTISFGDGQIELQPVKLSPAENRTKLSVLQELNTSVNKAMTAINSNLPTLIFHGCDRAQFDYFKRKGLELKAYQGVTHDFGIGPALYLGTDLAIALNWCVRKASLKKNTLSGNVMIFGMQNLGEIENAGVVMRLSATQDEHGAAVQLEQSVWYKTLIYCRNDEDAGNVERPVWLDDFDIFLGPMGKQTGGRWLVHHLGMDQIMIRSPASLTWFSRRLLAALAVDLDVGKGFWRTTWADLMLRIRIQ